MSGLPCVPEFLYKERKSIFFLKKIPSMLPSYQTVIICCGKWQSISQFKVGAIAFFPQPDQSLFVCRIGSIFSTDNDKVIKVSWSQTFYLK